jgi:hypothetical protein
MPRSQTAVQLSACFDRESTDAERVAAAILSSTIREYSAGEHFPRAIICPQPQSIVSASESLAGSQLNRDKA